MKFILLTFIFLFFSSATFAMSKEEEVVYLEALLLSKKKSRFIEKVKEIVSEENQEKPLLVIAKLAKEYNIEEASNIIYEKIISVNPNNSDAIKEIAYNSFQNSEYKYSYKFLLKFHSLNKETYLSHYYLAEIYLFTKNYEKADEHYALALDLINKNKKTIDSLIIKANILTRKGDDEAIKIYKELYKKNKDKLYIILSYASTLFQFRKFEKSYSLLSQFPEFDKWFTKDRDVSDIIGDDIEKIKQAKLQVEITRLRYYLRTRETEKAYEAYDKLIKNYPNNQTVLALKSDIILQKGNYIEGDKSLNDVLELTPTDEDIQLRQRELELDFISFVGTDFEYKDLDTGSEFISQFQLEYNLPDNFDLGYYFKNNSISIDSLQTYDSLGKYSGNHNSHELFLRNYFNNGDTLKTGFLFNDEILGVEFDYNLIDFSGSTKIELKYKAPSWDLLAGIAKESVKNEIKLSRIYRLSSQITLSGNLRKSKYYFNEKEFNSTDDYELATQSFGYGYGASYEIDAPKFLYDSFGYNSALFFNYFIDGEDYSNIREKTDINGLLYEPLSFADREVHTVNFLLAKTLSEESKFETSLGYSKDRIGDSSGMSLGGTYTYRDFPKYFQIRFGHSVGTTKGFYLGLSLKYLF